MTLLHYARLVFISLLSLAVFLATAESARPLEQAQTLSLSEKLQHADANKSVDFQKFSLSLKELAQKRQALSSAQKDLLRYLELWEIAYQGNSLDAISGLREFLLQTLDPVLALRARASLVNVLLIAKRSEEAFAEGSEMIELLAEVKDATAVEQANLTAAMMYAYGSQFGLSQKYAESVLASSSNNKTLCKAGQVQVDALYRSKKLMTDNALARQVVELCDNAGELIFAGLVRISMAKALADKGDAEAALALLQRFRDQALATQYPRLISEFEATVARVQHMLDRLELAQESAQRAIANSTRDEFSEPLLIAYHVLLEVAKKRSDYAAALHFFELYSATDKGYLNEISARQIAYQVVLQETQAAKNEVRSLNEKNEVLRLQEQLSIKREEASRLYVALLSLGIAFLVFWIYKTKRLQMHFMRLARVDALTGVANRAYLIESSARILAKARSSGAPAAVAILDLDFFKRVNDRFGHLAGDAVLKSAVQAVAVGLDERDIFGRLGGEEFAIVMVGKSTAEVLAQLEALRTTIAATRTAIEGQDLSVTASFGVAQASDVGYEWRELISHADKALYEAKHQGRNRIVLYQSSQEGESMPGEVPTVGTNEPLAGSVTPMAVAQS